MTISVGDEGNELGMGVIKGYVEDKIHFGSECRTPVKLARHLEKDY